MFNSSMQAQTPQPAVMKGITASTIATKRLTTRVLTSGEVGGTPVVFLHGNLTSATWWEETMLALPKGFRGIAPDLRGFGGADTSAKIDATRGAGDWADDVIALLDQLHIEKAHIVGNSLGGYVVWRLMADYSSRLLSVTLVAPGAPYGFGGTKDVAGTLCFSDAAGTGAGLGNPLLIKAMKDGDRSLNSMFTPRFALRNVIVKPPFIPAREEELVSSMLTTHLNAATMPGDAVPSANWPLFAPGTSGIINALSPKYCGNVARVWAAGASKVPVLWIRGANDVIVSNSAASDIGTLGMRGIVPNYPGKDVYPPQPMLDQIRAVLDKYKAVGGSYREVVIENCGHVPYLEKSTEFNTAFHALLQGR
jgi:pimeloyl-ACP methyl ester carboxylesterase